MALLNTKDPQFGISVASRINADLAHELNKQANREGITISRLLSRIIESGNKNIEKMNKMKRELIAEGETNLASISHFIVTITKGQEKQVNEYIELFKSIKQNEKNKRNRP